MNSYYVMLVVHVLLCFVVTGVFSNLSLPGIEQIFYPDTQSTVNV